MATIIPVPSMSTQGFVTDLSGKLDLLLAHFFLADYNQTQLYPGRVISLPEIIERCGGDATQAPRLLERALMDYLGRYYRSVTVTCTPSTDQTVDFSVSVDLLLNIGINDGDQVGRFERLVQSRNSKMNAIIKLNNG